MVIMAIMVIIVIIAIMHNHSVALLCIITSKDLGHFWLGYIRGGPIFCAVSQSFW